MSIGEVPKAKAIIMIMVKKLKLQQKYQNSHHDIDDSREYAGSIKKGNKELGEDEYTDRWVEMNG